MIPLIILAGGLGSRIKHIAKDQPKALVKINGKPFISHQLSYLKEQGIQQVFIAIGYLGFKIRSYLGDGSDIGLKITYSEDGNEPLGTGGAVLKIARSCHCEAFFVTYGDSFLPINHRKMLEFHQGLSSKPNLMAIMKNKNRLDKSNVETKDGLVSLYDKNNPTRTMDSIDYGLSILDRKTFIECNTTQTFDLGDYFHKLSRSGELSAYHVKKRFYEIGSVNGIADAEAYFKRRDSNIQ